MRAIVQRVSSASVDVADERIAAIAAGLLVYLGVGRDDQKKDAEYLADKMLQLRVFRDDAGKMNRSVVEIGGAILVVSNFTLYGDARKGRRPSYVAAAPPEIAEPMYEYVCDRLADRGVEIQRGRFQAMMDVAAVNDGPINVLLDSARQF